MSNKSTLIISAVLILAAILAGLLFWNQLPAVMASHWNEQNQVDGYMSKFWGVFMLPLMMVGLTLLFIAIPSIDPLKKNIAEFRGLLNIFIVVFNLFMLYVHGLTLAWNLGNTGFNMGMLLLPAVGALFILIGIGLPRAKRNYFIGIRTPWTLTNDTVWVKTHRLGGLLFVASGVVSILGIFFQDLAIWFTLVPVFTSTAIILVYSYLIFRQEEKKSSHPGALI